MNIYLKKNLILNCFILKVYMNKLDNETTEHLKEIIEIVKRKIIEEILI